MVKQMFQLIVSIDHQVSNLINLSCDTWQVCENKLRVMRTIYHDTWRWPVHIKSIQTSIWCRDLINITSDIPSWVLILSEFVLIWFVMKIIADIVSEQLKSNSAERNSIRWLILFDTVTVSITCFSLLSFGFLSIKHVIKFMDRYRIVYTNTSTIMNVSTSTRLMILNHWECGVIMKKPF